jgi:hypothetical protein
VYFSPLTRCNQKTAGKTIGTPPAPANPGPIQADGKLYLPIIFKNFDPAQYTLVPDLSGLLQADAEADILTTLLRVGTITQESGPTQGLSNLYFFKSPAFLKAAC